jgi:cellulose synthase/poly-beta-1,6-N-acetylglucosamine synthase-like glycosyltransferase
LGLRLEKNGHRVAIVNSTTLEEANTHYGNWIRQRSRWMKGHMQTFLVHMRHPIRLFKEIGPVGFFGFCFFIGAPCVIAILNPLLWAVVTITSLTPFAQVEHYFPSQLRYLFLGNLILGNILFIGMGAMAVVKRKYWSLLPWAVTLPIYWFMQSIAAYKALWQLIHKPHFWEKTTHGLSAQMKEQNAKAAETLKASPQDKGRQPASLSRGDKAS